MPFIAVNPSSEEVIARYESLNEAGLERALDRASRAYDTWRSAELKDRAQRMVSAAELLESEIPVAAELMTREMGKTFAAAKGEAAKCAMTMRYFAEHASVFLETEYIATSFNLDVETVGLLASLVKTMRVKYLDLVSQLIEQYLADDARFKILSESDVLLEDPPSSESLVMKRFNFTTDIDALLEYLCEAVLASTNKSAMIRALIKVEAELQGLREKPQSKRRRRRGRSTPRQRTKTKQVARRSK